MHEVVTVSDYCVILKDVVNKMATLEEAMNNEVVIKRCSKLWHQGGNILP